MSLPKVIQGGMGVAISDWKLARTVSSAGQLGVVAGTALDQVLARRLQEGDPGGHMRLALDHFPQPAIAERIWQEFYIPGGKAANAGFRRLPLLSHKASRESIELVIVANFVEVFLARQGHSNPVGINFLEKIQIPHLASIYGAMLAGVDYILMGAGIPLRIPGILDRYVTHSPADYPLTVTGPAEGEDSTLHFNPKDYLTVPLPDLTRPRFLAIIASNTLALTLLKKANGRVDGFIVEGPVAGGHNAPPRGKMQLSESGEPIYGERDQVDLPKLRELGVPFWLAGGYGAPGKLADALAAGATGIQVGTAFAFSRESGLHPDLKHSILAEVATGQAHVFTDPQASPTGFPFKVVPNAATDLPRPRICDLGYLREAYRTATGAIDYRCPGEPATIFAAKGGNPEETHGRKCLCNGLMANIGLQQIRNSKHIEPALVTAGDDLPTLSRFFPPGSTDYSALDVLQSLLPPRGGQPDPSQKSTLSH